MKFMEVKERGKVFAYCGILFLMLGMALLVLFGGDVLASAADNPVASYTSYATLTFEKAWEGDETDTSTRPEEITFTVDLVDMNDPDKTVSNLPITLTAANNWSLNLTANYWDLYKDVIRPNGYPSSIDTYNYVNGSIDELKVDGYTPSGASVLMTDCVVDKIKKRNDFSYTITLTNKKDVPLSYATLTFKKIWEGEDGDTSKRPEEITFTVDLEYLNEAVDSSKPTALKGVPITLKADEGWTFKLPETYTADGETYSNLDEYKPVEGSISEVKVDGYTCESAAVTDDGNGNYTVTLKNAKVPEPTPDNEPTPEPEPTPDNEPTPEPEPTPDNEPTPEPEPTPDNKPTPEPEPTPDNKPTPEPTPVTTPAPTPVPEEPALETPKTGDSTDATVWMLPTFGGAAGLTAVLLYRRRRAAGKR